MKIFLNIIRNLLNPKVKRPADCVCPEEEYRFFTAHFNNGCPLHDHHISI